MEGNISMTNTEAETKVEECLETIYKLEEGKRVKTTVLAEATGYPASTITTLLLRLSNRGLVEYEAFRGAKLTEKGRKMALRVIRRHRLTERMLTDMLDIGWDDAHKEACRLEHAVSMDVAQRMEEALGHPKTCPHGNPIPDEEGRIPEVEEKLLSEASIPEEVVVARIIDEDPELLRSLSSVGITPGEKIIVEGRSPLGGVLIIRVGKDKVPVSEAVSTKIMIKQMQS